MDKPEASLSRGASFKKLKKLTIIIKPKKTKSMKWNQEDAEDDSEG